jgi:secreted PhoX family phosphatase
LFIANTNGGNVLEITAANLASSGSPTVTDYADGVGSAYGLAFDSSGNLYVSDWGNSIIYQVQPGGSPTVYIQTPGHNNTIDQPAGLAFDSQGNLYVANDGSLDNIEEFTGTNADGAIASGTAQFLDSPEGIAFDSKGNLFVVNYSHTPPDTGQPLSYGYSSIDEFAPVSQGSTLLNTFNVDTSTDFSLKDGGFIAIESDSGVPLLGPIPEPTALDLTILGIASLAGFTWKRRRL